MTATVWQATPKERRTECGRPVLALELRGRPAARPQAGDVLHDLEARDEQGCAYLVPRALVVRVAADGLVEAESSGPFQAGPRLVSTTYTVPNLLYPLGPAPADEPQIVAAAPRPAD